MVSGGKANEARDVRIVSVEMDEREAIARAKRRDLSGLEALVQLHQQSAVRLAAFITRDRPLAEDIVSECFLVAYDRLGQFDDQRPFQPWFHRSVANAALKAVSHQHKFVSLENWPGDNGTMDHWLERVTSAGRDPLEAAEQAEVHTAVREAIASLSPRQRAVLALRYVSGLSEAETAEMLGVPPGTVKSRLAAALNRLRGLLVDLKPE
jgi:RNA polymerase sigma-70 factor (ECF subfamily)